MSRQDEVRKALEELGASPQEAAELDAVAGQVQQALAQPAPLRPGFREELRARLMAEARRQAGAGTPAATGSDAAPWDTQPLSRVDDTQQLPRVDDTQPVAIPFPRSRRAARASRPFWPAAGWVATAATAAAALVIYLNSGQQPPAPAGAPDPAAGAPVAATPAAPAPPAAVAPAPQPPGAVQPPGGIRMAAYAVEGSDRRLPLPGFLAPDAGARPPAGISAAPGNARVTWQPGRALQFNYAYAYELVPHAWTELDAARVSGALGLPAPARETAPVAWSSAARDGSGAAFRIMADGTLLYQGAANPAPAPELSAGAAAETAAQFLRGLGFGTVAAGQPVVRRAPHGAVAGAWWVEWPYETSNHTPILGTPNQVVLAPGGAVLAARVQAVAVNLLHEVPLKDPALAARELDGTVVAGGGAVILTAVDLVYARPESAPAGEPLVAQPYYRFAGHTAEGWPYVGYVPAVAGAPGPQG